MPYKTEVLADVPVIIHTLEPGPDMVAELPKAMQEVAEILSAQPRPVYLVLDLRALRMGVEDMAEMSDKAARGPNAIMHHPNIIETLFVMGNSFMRLGVMGMTNEVYGSVRLRTFDTLEGALSFCAEQIKEKSRR